MDRIAGSLKKAVLIIISPWDSHPVRWLAFELMSRGGFRLPVTQTLENCFETVRSCTEYVQALAELAGAAIPDT